MKTSYLGWRDLLETARAGFGRGTFLSLAAAMAISSWLFPWQIAIGLFLGIAWHEFGHMVAAHQAGITVGRAFFIPMIGGVAQIGHFNDAWSEVKVALAGPCFGLAYAFAAALIGAVFKIDSLVAIGWLHAVINLFNLMPVYPLDGGRVLRAISRGTGFEPLVSLAGMAIALALGILWSPVMLFVAMLCYMERSTERAKGNAEIFVRNIEACLNAATGIPEKVQEWMREEVAKRQPLLEMGRVLPMPRKRLLHALIISAVLGIALLAVLYGSSLYPNLKIWFKA